MGLHRLQDLKLLGREGVLAALPGFDLYHLGHVESLALRRAAGVEAFELEIEAIYEEEREYSVTLLFSGVRSARLPPLEPSFYFGELEIEDVRGDQLEEIRYRARDFGGTGFE